MLDQQQTLEELQQKTGIRDLKNLSTSDVDKVLKLAGNGTLSETHVKALVGLTPDFIQHLEQLSVKTLETISKLPENAKASQVEALATVQSSIKGMSEMLGVLKTLAENAQTDETREKIGHVIVEFSKLYVELSKISQQMNTDNNAMWKALATTALSVFAIVSSVLVAVLKSRG